MTRRRTETLTGSVGEAFHAHGGAIAVLIAATGLAPVVSIWTQVLLARTLGSLGVLGASQVTPLLERLAVMLGTASLLSVFSMGYSARIVTQIVIAMRVRLQNAIAFNVIPQEYLSQGDVMARLATDIPTFVTYRISVYSSIVGIATTVMSVGALGWSMSAQLTVIWMTSAALYYVAPMVARNRLRNLAQLNRTAWGRVASNMLGVVRSADALKMLPGHLRRLDHYTSDWQDAGRAAIRETVSNGLVGWFQGLLQSGMTLLVLVVGLVALGKGDIGPGAVIAFILLQQQLGTAVLALAQIPIARNYESLSESRLEPYFDSPLHEVSFAHNGNHAAEIRHGAVRIGERMLLKEVSFTLPREGVVLVTGPNGSGKSQLVRSLLGLAPVDEGEIIWNAALRGKIGYVPQEVSVLPGSLRYNVALGRSIPDEVLLGQFEEMGWNNPPLDRRLTDGSALSGGEAKRMGLVRALADGPEVMVVDELEADLDNAYVVVEQLVKKMPLIIAVSHRPELWPDDALRVEVSTSGVATFGRGVQAFSSLES